MKLFELANIVLQVSVDWAPWAALAVARPAGFALLFAPFAWGNIATGTMRMAFAMALAIPALHSGIEGRVIEDLTLPISIALVKEVFIGGLLGFFASIPYAIAKSGGDIIDIYRGSSSGDADPSGGQITPYSKLIVVASLWIFANMGGFWVVAGLIHSSYDLWPVQSAFPVITEGAHAALLAIETIAIGALIISAPLLVIMFVSDFAHLVSTKFGKQINITHLSFSSKNLIVIIILPFMFFYLARVLREDNALLVNVSDLMRMLLK